MNINLTTWNEPFEQALSILDQSKQFEPAITKKFRKSLNAPLFIHDLGSEDWLLKDFPWARDDKQMLRLPFPMLRATLTDHKRLLPENAEARASLLQHFNSDLPDIVTETVDVVAFQHEVATFSLMRIRSSERLAALTQLVFAGVEMHHQCVGVMCHLPTNRIIGKGETVGNYDHVLDAVFGWAIEFLTKLTIDWLNPHLFPARVCPKRQGKSVEWKQARSHYVMVHKSANVSKPTGRHHEVTSRVAHSRRAHWHMLTSDRWKNKKGQRVPVKATWVGPEEWEGQSGQIYTMDRALHEARFKI